MASRPYIFAVVAVLLLARAWALEQETNDLRSTVEQLITKVQSAQTLYIVIYYSMSSLNGHEEPLLLFLSTLSAASRPPPCPPPHHCDRRWPLCLLLVFFHLNSSFLSSFIAGEGQEGFSSPPVTLFLSFTCQRSPRSCQRSFRSLLILRSRKHVPFIPPFVWERLAGFYPGHIFLNVPGGIAERLIRHDATVPSSPSFPIFSSFYSLFLSFFIVFIRHKPPGMRLFLIFPKVVRSLLPRAFFLWFCHRLRSNGSKFRWSMTIWMSVRWRLRLCSKWARWASLSRIPLRSPSRTHSSSLLVYLAAFSSYSPLYFA